MYLWGKVRNRLITFRFGNNLDLNASDAKKSSDGFTNIRL